MVEKTIQFSESDSVELHSCLRFPDNVFQIGGRRMISVRPRRHSDFGRAHFVHRLLGPNIVFSDEEHNALNKLEGVIQQ